MRLAVCFLLVVAVAACYPNPDDLRPPAHDVGIGGHLGGGGGTAGQTGGGGRLGTGGTTLGGLGGFVVIVGTGGRMGAGGGGGLAAGTGGRGSGGASPPLGTGGSLGTGGRLGTGGGTPPLGTGGRLGTGGVASPAGTGGRIGGTGGGPMSCTDPSYPMACPAAGTVPADCWTPGTVCSTIVDCNGVPSACSSASLKVYCASDQCCTPPAAGGSCALPACGCPTGQVCSPDTPATGLACFTAGITGEGGDCTATGTCQSGLGCIDNVCLRYCTTDLDCTLVDGTRKCAQTTWSSTGNPIPGVLFCERMCDPVSPQSPRSPLLSCPPGFGCTITADKGVTFCEPNAGTGTQGAFCVDDTDCKAGYYCDADSSCYKFCYGSTDCPSGTTCQLFSPAAYAGTRALGACF